MSKTNAIRILESHKIIFETISYKVDEDDLSGETVALKIGANPESVFKTLVCVGDKKWSYCVLHSCYSRT